MNFDYYKEVGLFTDEHQAALDQYYEDIQAVNTLLSSTAEEITTKENALNELWGQPDYVVYYGENMDDRFTGGTVYEKD
jgi:hypothetical protein